MYLYEVHRMHSHGALYKLAKVWNRFLITAFSSTLQRIQDVTYPGRFVPKTFRTQVGCFVPRGLNVSYRKSGRFVHKSWSFGTLCGLFHTQVCLFFPALGLVVSYLNTYHLFSRIKVSRLWERNVQTSGYETSTLGTKCLEYEMPNVHNSFQQDHIRFYSK